MKNTVTGELPRHFYVGVDSAFTHKESQGFIPAVWFGLVSLRARMWGCTVLLESGAIYRNIPVHALTTMRPHSVLSDWTPQDAQRWECYGDEFSCLEYKYLTGLEVAVKVNSGDNEKILSGENMFSVCPVDDGFSAYPEQAKEFTFIQLDNGRITVQPTDFIIFRERSFTTNDAMVFPKGIRRQTEIWTCE